MSTTPPLSRQLEATCQSYRQTRNRAQEEFQAGTAALLEAFAVLLPSCTVIDSGQMSEIPGLEIVNTSREILILSEENILCRCPPRAYDGRRYATWERRVTEPLAHYRHAGAILEAFDQFIHALNEQPSR